MKRPSDFIKNEESNSASNRRDFLKKASLSGLGAGFLTVNSPTGIFTSTDTVQSKTTPGFNIKITDLRCAIMGNSPVVRITTDQGIDGYGQAETAKPYLKPFVLFYNVVEIYGWMRRDYTE